MSRELTLFSWNVNGLRACIKNGFRDWFAAARPDILALQETRVDPSQLEPEEREPSGYTSLWQPALKKGYSGTAIFIRKDIAVDEIYMGMGEEKFDTEGRVLGIRLGNNVIFNCYFPNTQRDHARLGFKLEYNRSMHGLLQSHAAAGRLVIICGDFNVAHREIDLKNPKANENNAGFLPEERAWMTEFLDSGYLDTFRYFYPDAADQYTWWAYMFKARSKNIGWRIDYFCVNRDFKENLVKADIHSQVMGSDHCPISLKIKI